MMPFPLERSPFFEDLGKDPVFRRAEERALKSHQKQQSQQKFHAFRVQGPEPQRHDDNLHALRKYRH